MELKMGLVFDLDTQESLEYLVLEDAIIDKAAYDAKANELAGKFNANFAKYEEFANEEIMAAAPRQLTN